jgi:hypothetical protein
MSQENQPNVQNPFPTQTDRDIVDVMTQIQNLRDQILRISSQNQPQENSENSQGTTNVGTVPPGLVSIPVSEFLPHLFKVIPMVLIPFLIFLYYHYVGFFIFFFCLMSTFSTDKNLTSQVSLKENRNISKLGVVLLTLGFHIAIVFYFVPFSSLSAFFTLQNDQSYGFFMSIWYCLIVDFLVKMISMAIKCCLIIAFGGIHEYHHGRIYHGFELISSIYRGVIAIGVWIPYFEKDFSSSKIFSITLITLYLSYKIFSVGNKFKSLFQFVSSVISRKPRYGRHATEAESLEDGNCCSICQDAFVDPIGKIKNLTHHSIGMQSHFL